MNDGGKIIKNCIEYARQADIQNGEQGGQEYEEFNRNCGCNGEMNKNCYQCALEWLQQKAR